MGYENMNNNELKWTRWSDDLECGTLLWGMNVVEVGRCSWKFRLTTDVLRSNRTRFLTSQSIIST